MELEVSLLSPPEASTGSYPESNFGRSAVWAWGHFPRLRMSDICPRHRSNLRNALIIEEDFTAISCNGSFKPYKFSDISGSHNSEYEDKCLWAMLRHVVLQKFTALMMEAESASETSLTSTRQHGARIQKTARFLQTSIQSTFSQILKTSLL
jgi:hypothetical protein